jgi:hypothetical protein
MAAHCMTGLLTVRLATSWYMHKMLHYYIVRGA